MAKRTLYRPTLEPLDGRILPSSKVAAVVNTFPSYRIFNHFFGKPDVLPQSLIIGNATAGAKASDLNLQEGWGSVRPFGRVTVREDGPTVSVRTAGTGVGGTISLRNHIGKLVGQIELEETKTPATSTSGVAFNFTEKQVVKGWRAASDDPTFRDLIHGRALLSYPEGAPTPGGPPMQVRILLQPMTKSSSK